MPWTATGDFSAIEVASWIADWRSVGLSGSVFDEEEEEEEEEEDADERDDDGTASRAPITRLTNPTRSASLPSHNLPLKQTSFPQLPYPPPTTFPNLVNVPISAAKPRSTSFTLNFVEGVQRRMSAQQAISIPRPRQWPWRAAMRGFGVRAREEMQDWKERMEGRRMVRAMRAGSVDEEVGGEEEEGFGGGGG